MERTKGMFEATWAPQERDSVRQRLPPPLLLVSIGFPLRPSPCPGSRGPGQLVHPRGRPYHLQPISILHFPPSVRGSRRGLCSSLVQPGHTPASPGPGPVLGGKAQLWLRLASSLEPRGSHLRGAGVPAAHLPLDSDAPPFQEPMAPLLFKPV